jgi:hypothetical protein
MRILSHSEDLSGFKCIRFLAAVCIHIGLNRTMNEYPLNVLDQQNSKSELKPFSICASGPAEIRLGIPGHHQRFRKDKRPMANWESKGGRGGFPLTP